MHNYPGMPVGQFGIRAGSMMAAADFVTIDIEGVGGHAARPHLGIDTRAGRRADHQHIAVDRLAQRRSAGVGGGVDLHVPRRQYRQRHSADRAAARHRAQPEPRRAGLSGEAHASRSSRARRQLHGAKVKLKYRRGYPVLKNHARADRLRGVGRQARSPARTKSTPTCAPVMGAEDFSFMLNARPGRLHLRRQRRQRRPASPGLQFQRRRDPGRHLVLGEAGGNGAAGLEARRRCNVFSARDRRRGRPRRRTSPHAARG